MDKESTKQINSIARKEFCRKYAWIPLILIAVGGLFLFAAMDSAYGPVKEVKGIVVGVSIDSSNPYDNPVERISVELENGDRATVEVPEGVVILEGWGVVLGVYKHRITKGNTYKFERREKIE